LADVPRWALALAGAIAAAATATAGAFFRNDLRFDFAIVISLQEEG
jgi:hypothetical protein